MPQEDVVVKQDGAGLGEVEVPEEDRRWLEKRDGWRLTALWAAAMKIGITY